MSHASMPSSRADATVARPTRSELLGAASRGLATLLGCLALSGALATASPAAAQTTLPMEDLLLPLVVAAEADAGAGRSALAIARARLVLASLPPTSALRVRAQGVELVSTQALAGAPYVEPGADEVLGPLVTEAESETQRGLPSVAIARLDFALARLASGSALALRASGLRDAARSALAPSSTPPTTGYGGPSAYGGYAPAPATAPSAPQIVVPAGTSPYGASPYATTGSELPPPEPADPTRPGGGEIVQLYISLGMMGALTGFYIPFAAGMDSSDFGFDSGDMTVAYTLCMLLGAGVGVVGAFGLTQADLRTGGPGTISVGFRWGFALGALTMGTMINGGYDQAEVSTALWGSALGGTLLGVTLALTVQPTAHQAHFIEPGGLWGAGLGGLLAAAILPEVRGDVTAGFGLAIGGMSVGLLTHIIMAASTDVNTGRGWLMAGGFAIGVAAGSLVPAFGMLLTDDDFSPLLFGAFGSIFGLAGLTLAAVFSDGMGAPRSAEAQAAELDINFGIAPQPEGALATVSGRF